MYAKRASKRSNGCAPCTFYTFFLSYVFKEICLKIKKKTYDVVAVAVFLDKYELKWISMLFYLPPKSSLYINDAYDNMIFHRLYIHGSVINNLCHFYDANIEECQRVVWPLTKLKSISYAERRRQRYDGRQATTLTYWYPIFSKNIPTRTLSPSTKTTFHQQQQMKENRL